VNGGGGAKLVSEQLYLGRKKVLIRRGTKNKTQRWAEEKGKVEVEGKETEKGNCREKRLRRYKASGTRSNKAQRERRTESSLREEKGPNTGKTIKVHRTAKGSDRNRGFRKNAVSVGATVEKSDSPKKARGGKTELQAAPEHD